MRCSESTQGGGSFVSSGSQEKLFSPIRPKASKSGPGGRPTLIYVAAIEEIQQSKCCGDENHGRNYRQTNRPKRLRWGNPRQSTKANDPADPRENTRPIWPVPELYPVK